MKEKETIIELVKKYQKNKRQTYKNKLVDKYFYLVRTIARKICFKKDLVDDATQVGMMGLLKAFDSFNGKQEQELDNYIIKKVLGEIRHFFRDSLKLIKIPRKYLNANKQVKKYVQQFIQKTNGKYPTISQIAAGAGMSEELVLESMEATYAVFPLSFSPSYAAQEDGSQQILEIKKEDYKGAKEISAADKIMDRVFIDNLLEQLKPNERKVLRLYFWNNMNQRAIAKRVGLSQAQVFRTLNKAIEHCKMIVNNIDQNKTSGSERSK